MSISYLRIKKHPKIFVRLLGVKPHEFELLVLKLQKLWQEKVISKYKRPGRFYKMPLEDMFMMLLLYYRTYNTQMQIGFMFGIDDSRVCRIIKTLEPLVAKLMAIEKNRTLSPEETQQLIDVTEQPLERPSKGQRKFFSGKKKRHTLKTEIRVTSEGRICNVSKSHPGKIHDFNIHKQSDRIPINTKTYVDSGYQGLKKRCKNAKVPIKKRKNKALTYWQRLYNKILSQRRVLVENTIAQLKNFRILTHRYRNKRKGYNLKFNIIVGLVNLKNGFMNKMLEA